MEPLTTRRRHHHHRRPSGERYLRLSLPPSSSSSSHTPSLELSENDIFTTPVQTFTPPPTRLNPNHNPNPIPSPKSKPKPRPGPNITSANHYGILAALNRTRFGSGSSARPVFNIKASVTTSTPEMAIPRRAAVEEEDRVRVYRHQSAPVNVPVIPEELRRRARAREMEDAVPEEEELDGWGPMVPPHEIVAARTPRLSTSVVEGSGRTLKGRDMRQVRNAVWRKTGFL